MEEPITNTFFIHIILNVGFVQYPPAYSLNTLSMNSVKIKSSKDYVFTRSVLTMTQKWQPIWTSRQMNKTSEELGTIKFNKKL